MSRWADAARAAVVARGELVPDSPAPLVPSEKRNVSDELSEVVVEAPSTAGAPAYVAEPPVRAPHLAGHEATKDATASSPLAKFLRRFELAIYLSGGLGAALIVLAAQNGQIVADPFAETLFGLSCAIFLTWYVLSRLREHAKAQHLSYVLPVNFLVFSGALAAIALLRLPYSGSLYLSGATATTAISFLLAIYGRRLMKPHVIVSGGRTNEIKITGQYKAAPALADLERLVQSGRRDWAIVADLHYCHSDRWERLFAKAALAGVPVYHFRQIAEMQTGQVKINHLSENDLGSLIPNVSYMSAKRVIDVLGALLLLPFCLVAFALIAALIKTDSPGRAFFIQERLGFRGEKFQMIKFRTMHERCEEEAEAARREDAMTKNDDDRITRLGRFLRKSRLDELPQILNVIKGDMSFIGPRPEALSLAQWYEEELPFYSYRHITRPGITGWAQVNQGHVTEVSDVLSKVRYDFYYIKNISLWLDFLIVLKTIRVIVTGLGAK